MLIGQYSLTLTEKNRIAFPKKFRAELGKEFIITRGFEQCLVIVNKKSWEDITKDVSVASYGLSEMREVSRFLIGGAAEVNLDKQGRFVLPDNLLKYAGLNKEIEFIGLVRWIEVWDSKKWQEKTVQIKKEVGDKAQTLSSIINTK